MLGRIKNERIEYISVAIIIGWFIYQAYSISLHIRIGLPPDELHHTHLCNFYKEARWFSPQESASTYPYGPISIYPYLYHLVMGKLLWLNFFWSHDDYMLRFLNVLLSICTVTLSYSLFREVTESVCARLLALVILTSIPMFVFISGSVSYDNLTYLLTTLSILYAVRFLKQKKLIFFLSSLLYLLLGSLTKVVFLPLYPIFFILFLILSRRILPEFFTSLRAPFSIRDKFLLLAVVIAIIANVRLYGGNYLTYGSIFPSPEVAMGAEKAYHYFPQAKRDEDYRLAAYQKPMMSPLEFIPKYFGQVARTTFGIMAHKSHYRSEADMNQLLKGCIPFLVGLVCLVVVGVRNFNKALPPMRDALLFSLSISLIYTLITMIDNYNGYTIFRAFGMGLQGRYLFSVLPGMAIAFSVISLFWLPKRLRLIIAVGLGWFFVEHGMMQLSPVVFSPAWSV